MSKLHPPPLTDGVRSAGRRYAPGVPRHRVAYDVLGHPLALAVAEVEALHGRIRVALADRLPHGPAEYERRRDVIEHLGPVAQRHPDDLVGPPDVRTAHRMVVHQVVHHRAVVINGVDVVGECAPVAGTESEARRCQVAADRAHAMLPALGTRGAVGGDGHQALADPLHRIARIRADQYVDIIVALVQKAREQERTEEARPTREQYAPAVSRCHRWLWQRRDIEAQARVPPHQLGLPRTMLLCQLAQCALELEPGVRRSRLELLQQAEQLADRYLLEHVQVHCA